MPRVPSLITDYHTHPGVSRHISTCFSHCRNCWFIRDVRPICPFSVYASAFFHVSFVFHSFCSRIYPFRAFSGLFVINQTDIPDFARFPPPFFDIKPTRKQKGEPPNPRPTALLFLCFLTFRDATAYIRDVRDGLLAQGAILTHSTNDRVTTSTGRSVFIQGA